MDAPIIMHHEGYDLLTVHMKCCSHCCHDRLVAIAVVLQYGRHYPQGPMALCSNLFIRLPLLATVFRLLAPSMQHSLRSTLIMLVLDRVPLNFTRKEAFISNSGSATKTFGSLPRNPCSPSFTG